MRRSASDRRVFLWQAGIGVAATGLVRPGPVAAAPPGAGDAAAALELRKEELQRRVAALPTELKRWQERARHELDEQIHFSQMRALGVLMDAFVQNQTSMLGALNPRGGERRFLEQALALVLEIDRAQGVWDFYRTKLQLRFSPDYRASLRAADIVALDCYRPVLDEAVRLGILSRAEVREPPLCYYVADFSPATWVRGSEPTDLVDRQGGTVVTPIPVIQLPWDHAQNLWEFPTIAHEVGHDLEADLKLRPDLLKSLEDSLRKGGVPDARVVVWNAWQAETFADLVALQLMGPGFLEALMHLLLLPPAIVTTYQGSDPHPTHYVRILMGAAYLRGLVPAGNQADQPHQDLANDAGQVERVWKGLYGDPPPLRDYLGDFPLVFKGLMDTPLPALKGKTVRALIPYRATDDRRIRAASRYLLSGQDRPARLRPRHCLAAARLAATEASQQGPAMALSLQSINERTAKLIDDSVPPGLFAGDDRKSHRDFVAGFAKTISVERGRRPRP